MGLRIGVPQNAKHEVQTLKSSRRAETGAQSVQMSGQLPATSQVPPPPLHDVTSLVIGLQHNKTVRGLPEAVDHEFYHLANPGMIRLASWASLGAVSSQQMKSGCSSPLLQTTLPHRPSPVKVDALVFSPAWRGVRDTRTARSQNVFITRQALHR